MACHCSFDRRRRRYIDVYLYPSFFPTLDSISLSFLLLASLSSFQWVKCSASKLLTEGCHIIRSSARPLSLSLVFPGHFTSLRCLSPDRFVSPISRPIEEYQEKQAIEYCEKSQQDYLSIFITDSFNEACCCVNHDFCYSNDRNSSLSPFIFFDFLEINKQTVYLYFFLILCFFFFIVIVVPFNTARSRNLQAASRRQSAGAVQ